MKLLSRKIAMRIISVIRLYVFLSICLYFCVFTILISWYIYNNFIFYVRVFEDESTNPASIPIQCQKNLMIQKK